MNLPRPNAVKLSSDNVWGFFLCVCVFIRVFFYNDLPLFYMQRDFMGISCYVSIFFFQRSDEMTEYV